MLECENNIIQRITIFTANHTFINNNNWWWYEKNSRNTTVSFLKCFAVENIGSKVEIVLDISVETITWIMGRLLNSCLFTSLCEDLGIEHTALLFHTEDYWS